MLDGVLQQLHPATVLQADRPGPDQPRPGQDPVDAGQLSGGEQMPVGVVGQHRQRQLAGEQVAVHGREHGHLAAGRGVRQRLHQSAAGRREQVLDHEEAEHDVGRLIVQPDPAIVVSQLGEVARPGVQTERTPPRRELVQVGTQPFVLFRRRGQHDRRERARREAGLGTDRVDQLTHRVGVVQIMICGEVGQDGVIEQRPADLRVVDPGRRAAHVHLQQPEARRAKIEVGAGQRGRRIAPAAQHRGQLPLTRAYGPGEGGQVAAEQPVGQAGEGDAQVLHVGVQPVPLLMTEEHRPGQITA